MGNTECEVHRAASGKGNGHIDYYIKPIIHATDGMKYLFE